MKKGLYMVSAGVAGIDRCGRHPWFGPAKFGGSCGWANFVATRSYRHALAQYKRLPIRERQLDGPDPITGKKVCLRHRT